MYVVKVGEYYVRSMTPIMNEILLSNELQRGYSKETAEKLADKLNGEVIEIVEEVSCE